MKTLRGSAGRASAKLVNDRRRYGSNKGYAGGGRGPCWDDTRRTSLLPGTEKAESNPESSADIAIFVKVSNSKPRQAFEIKDCIQLPFRLFG